MAASGEKKCGCSGIRNCLLCEDKNIPTKSLDLEHSTRIQHYKLCIQCGDTLRTDQQCKHCRERDKMDFIALEGVSVIQGFVDEVEEQSIVTEIDRTIWKPSQSGRRKQVKQKWMPYIRHARGGVHEGAIYVNF